MMHLHAMYGQGWWWPHELIWAVVILVLAAMALAILAPATRSWLARWDPEQIFKRRYAQGEVDGEGYERALADLRR
ncbi:MAG: hypothetical protein KGM47_18920 [Acidobacteriota bacterium]|nr:hypothetical protein [Acidobacteriota bacterium]